MFDQQGRVALPTGAGAGILAGSRRNSRSGLRAAFMARTLLAILLVGRSAVSFGAAEILSPGYADNSVPWSLEGWCGLYQEKDPKTPYKFDYVLRPAKLKQVEFPPEFGFSPVIPADVHVILFFKGLEIPCDNNLVAGTRHIPAWSGSRPFIELGILEKEYRLQLSPNGTKHDHYRSLVLSLGNRTQKIHDRPFMGKHRSITWVGDLDGDNELDLLLELTEDTSDVASKKLMLYLSRGKGKGQLVWRAAERSTLAGMPAFWIAGKLEGQNIDALVRQVSGSARQDNRGDRISMENPRYELDEDTALVVKSLVVPMHPQQSQSFQLLQAKKGQEHQNLLLSYSPINAFVWWQGDENGDGTTDVILNILGDPGALVLYELGSSKQGEILRPKGIHRVPMEE